MMQFSRKHRRFIVPMNAMSDVAFLLLIFIMLVALINYRKEVHIDYPEAVESVRRVSDKKNLELWIDKSGGIYLDGTESSLVEIENTIEELYRTAPDTRIHVIADRDVPFVNVNAVLEILQLLEYRVVTFVVRESGRLKASS
ncbi:MAG: biopolymer transporter ExbD [Spirochaetaceae bacterium]|jgi:biopolymer transport protein ExbD|nr:biopolymer transporter ExbD [Spirochaetaceae bacterium]